MWQTFPKVIMKEEQIIGLFVLYIFMQLYEKMLEKKFI